MKRHQRRDQLPETGRPDEHRAIERMKTGSAHRRCIPDIVQPRRRHQTIRRLAGEMLTQPFRRSGHTPHMRQPPRLLSQPCLGLPPCTLRHRPAHASQLTSPSITSQYLHRSSTY